MDEHRTLNVEHVELSAVSASAAANCRWPVPSKVLNSPTFR